jgi:hypothetical protein
VVAVRSRPAPEYIGHYRLLKKVAEDAAGLVFEGVDQRDQTPVRVRLMAPQLALSSTFRERFAREAAKLAAVESEHTLKLQDHGYRGGWFYLVSEAPEGESVASRLVRGEMEPGEAAAIAVDVARALQEARAEAGGEGRVDPARVFLSRDGFVRLADVGIERLTAPVEPGQPPGESPTTLQQGVAELLSLMVEGPSATGAGAAPAEASARPAPQVPVEVREVIERALAKTPARRFVSPDDLIRALEPLARRAQAEVAAPAELVPAREPAATASEALSAVVGEAIEERRAQLTGAARPLFEVAQRAPSTRSLQRAATVTRAAPALRSLQVAAAFLVLTLLGVAALSVVAAVYAHRELTADPGTSLSELVDRDDDTDTALGFQLVTGALTWPLLAWFGWRVARVARGAGGASAAPGAFLSTWSWLIPGVNLIVPFIGLHRSLIASTPEGSGRRGVALAVVWLWWLVSLSSVVLAIVVFGLDDDPDAANGARMEALRDIQAVLAVASVLVVGFVVSLAAVQRSGVAALRRATP